jgi:hypothetical protein
MDMEAWYWDSSTTYTTWRAEEGRKQRYHRGERRIKKKP